MATPVYASMTAGPTDSMQPLLVKIAYFLQVAAEAGGASDASMPYATMAPSAQDTQQVLLVKIAYWASQITGGGGGGGGVHAFYPIHGSPEGVQSGSPGDTAWDLDTGDYYIKVTGTATTTGWEVH